MRLKNFLFIFILSAVFPRPVYSLTCMDPCRYDSECDTNQYCYVPMPPACAVCKDKDSSAPTSPVAPASGNTSSSYSYPNPSPTALRPNPFQLVEEETNKTFSADKDQMTVGVAEGPDFTGLPAYVLSSFYRFITPFLSPGQGGTGGGTVPGTPNTFQCDNENAPKPQAANIKFSADGKYAFPLAPVMGYGCNHWNNALATDIFVGNSSASDPPKNLPVLAYTTGEIIYRSDNDVAGGKNLILKGSDGRAYYYAHNCTVYVDVGSHVNVGEVIATTDQTGLLAEITPEHLHFAMIEGAGANPYFQNGGGNICPQTDFEQKFILGACTPSQQCALIP